MVIFDKDDKLLMTRRAARMNYFPSAWVFPGGHLEIGETLEEGVIREIVEETGIDIKQTILEDDTVHFTYQDTECYLEPFYAFESVSNKAFDINNPPSS